MGTEEADVKTRSPEELLVRQGQQDDMMVFAKRYLVSFGYMEKCRCSDQRLCVHVTKALEHFQNFTTGVCT